MELHQELYKTHRVDCHLSHQQKAIIDSLQFQYVKQWWECLCNAEEHHHSKHICMNEIFDILKNNRGKQKSIYTKVVYNFCNPLFKDALASTEHWVLPVSFLISTLCFGVDVENP